MSENTTKESDKSGQGFASWVWVVFGIIGAAIGPCSGKSNKNQTATQPIVSPVAPKNVNPVANVSSKDAIELVLNEYRSLMATKEFSVIVAKVRRINTIKCPSDFREAFMSHVHAIEAAQRSLETLDSAAEQLEKARNSPLGITSDLMDNAKDIRAQINQAKSVVDSTYNKVELISVKYGVDMNTRN